MDLVSKLRVHLDLPEFFVSVKNRDLPEIRRMIGRLTKAGYNPRQVSHMVVHGVPGLTIKQWDELLAEAYKPSEVSDGSPEVV